MASYLPLAKLIAADRCGKEHLEYPFPDDALALLGEGLEKWLGALLTKLGVSEAPVTNGEVSADAYLRGPVWVAAGAKIEPTASITGPCYLGPGAEVRHGAYLRGNCYVGAGAVVGHASEVKGSVLFDRAKAAHFAYVGDSILGIDANLGAGTKLANLKLGGTEVVFKDLNGFLCHSGLRKLGAILGDRVQTGCNAVLSPGSILGADNLIMPCTHFHGTRLARSRRET